MTKNLEVFMAFLASIFLGGLVGFVGADRHNRCIHPSEYIDAIERYPSSFDERGLFVISAFDGLIVVPNRYGLILNNDNLGTFQLLNTNYVEMAGENSLGNRILNSECDWAGRATYNIWFGPTDSCCSCDPNCRFNSNEIIYSRDVDTVSIDISHYTVDESNDDEYELLIYDENVFFKMRSDSRGLLKSIVSTFIQIRNSRQTETGSLRIPTEAASVYNKALAHDSRLTNGST